MYVVRFKVVCQPGRESELKTALAAVVTPSRAVDGVLGFDIAQDVNDSTSFMAIEVFEDGAAQERQESLREVGAVMALLPNVLAAPPAVTVFHVERAEALTM